MNSARDDSILYNSAMLQTIVIFVKRYMLQNTFTTSAPVVSVPRCTVLHILKFLQLQDDIEIKISMPVSFMAKSFVNLALASKQNCEIIKERQSR